MDAKRALGELSPEVMQSGCLRSQRIVQAFISGVLAQLVSIGYTEEAVQTMRGEFTKHNETGNIGVTMSGSFYVDVNTLAKMRREVEKKQSISQEKNGLFLLPKDWSKWIQLQSKYYSLLMEKEL